MSEELAGEVGELKGTINTFMVSQAQRDETLAASQIQRDLKIDARFEALLTKTEKADAKAEAAHKRISRLHWIGYGAAGVASSAIALAKFVFNHGEQVVKTVETIDRLHPK